MDTLTLKKPIPYGDGELKEMQLRRPQAGELRGVPLARIADLDAEVIMIITSRIAIPTVTVGQLAALDPPDLLALGGKIAGFFAD